MSIYEAFVEKRKQLLADFGYKEDQSEVERTNEGKIVFYHYTHGDRLESMFAPDGGLFARRPVACPKPPEEFIDCYMSEGFLEPLPNWLIDSPYFGGLGMEMVKIYIGKVLLRIEVPNDFPGLFVADYAHCLECKHLDLRGTAPLQLGYNCSTGHQVMQAYVHSYVEASEYERGHLAPLMQCVRKEQGIVIPNKHITISQVQPLQ